MPADFISSAAAAPDIFGKTNFPLAMADCTVRLAMMSFNVCLRFVLGVRRFLVAAFATKVFDIDMRRVCQRQLVKAVEDHDSYDSGTVMLLPTIRIGPRCGAPDAGPHLVTDQLSVA